MNLKCYKFSKKPSKSLRAALSVCAGITLLFLIFPGSAQAAMPLVSPQWLQEHLADDNIVILDLQPAQGYARVHIEGAVNTNFNKWRQPRPKKGMSLPDTQYLDELIGSLGISKDTHVILAPIGVNANEVAIATRIYWTFKVLGHDDISILDGGLIAYSALPEAKWSKQPVSVKRVDYKATADLSKVPQAAAVLAEWKKGTPFVDYRSEKEFYGQAGGARPGTIPNAKNLPFDLLVKPIKGGNFLSLSDIRKIFAERDIPTSGLQIAFCNSGHRASLGWFVSHELLGNKDVLLYDGSMSEWAKYPDYPITIPN